MKQGNCTHSDEERCLVGTWVVDEIHKAVEMGHGLAEVLEFLEYEVMCIDSDTNSGGLFAVY